jgi:hypothetical protein
MNRKLWTCLGLLLLMVLVYISWQLGQDRIIQVDEAQNAMQARLFATGKLREFMFAAPFMLLGPMTWIARAAKSSAELFHDLRFLFTLLFWANLLLMTKAAGVHLRSFPGLVVLLFAATLAPMWDYGFEIRHDNLLLTCVLGLWLLVRPRQDQQRPWMAVWPGMLAAFSHFIAFKAFCFWIPLLLLHLWWTFATRRDVLRVAGWLGLGLAVGFGFAWGLQLFAGIAEMGKHNYQGLAQVSMHTDRFAPWATLDRMRYQAPLAAAAGLALLARPFFRVRQEGWSFFLRDLGIVPEWAFLCLCTLVLLVNPTPFPYNLVLLVPAIFIGAARAGMKLAPALASWRYAWILAPALVGFHVLPWLYSNARHFRMTNWRQVEVMRMAESLTDPARQRVFDGSGLIPFRDPVSRDWLLHTFTIQGFWNGSVKPLRQQLAQVETPVILTSYRTSWLPEEDWAFLRAHFRPLAGDFAVLGFIRQDKAFTWEALATGRYALVLLPSGQGGEAWMDGQSLHPGIVHLAKGPHDFRFQACQGARLTWVGPYRESEPDLPEAAMPLFVNWY